MDFFPAISIGYFCSIYLIVLLFYYFGIYQHGQRCLRRAHLPDHVRQCTMHDAHAQVIRRSPITNQQRQLAPCCLPRYMLVTCSLHDIRVGTQLNDSLAGIFFRRLQTWAIAPRIRRYTGGIHVAKTSIDARTD